MFFGCRKKLEKYGAKCICCLIVLFFSFSFENICSSLVFGVTAPMADSIFYGKMNQLATVVKLERQVYYKMERKKTKTMDDFVEKEGEICLKPSQ